MLGVCSLSAPDRVLYESLIVPVLMYDREIIIWKEKERSMIRTV